MGVAEFCRNFIYVVDDLLWKVFGITLAFSLLIDGNGLLYAVANDVYGIGDKLDGTPFAKRKEAEISAIKERFKTDPASLEGQFLTTLTELLHNIVLKNIMPTDVLIIALDGIPPPAKAYQQRSRRFTGALDRLNKSLLAQFGSKNTSEYIFNTINFTVGTPIMKKACDTIQAWIDNNRTELPRYTYFSDCSEAGEGEHKMFRIFEGIEPQMEKDFADGGYVKTPGEIMRKSPHIVFGKDSDLFFLSAIRSDYNFFWVRDETFGFGNKTNRRDHDKVLEAISITAFRKLIVESMGGNFEKGTDIRGYMIDFALLSFPIGDDFVPPIPTLTLDSGTTLFKFMEAYKNFFTGRRLAPDGIINIRTYNEFLETLRPVEKELFEIKKEAQEIEFDYVNKVEKGQDSTVALRTRSKLRKSLRRDYAEFEPSELLLLEYEDFLDKWGDCIVCPSVTTDISVTGRTERYRQIALSMKDEELPEVCYNYLTGLQWNLLYYLGYNTNNWVYEWSFAPTLGHLSSFLKGNPDVELPEVLMSEYDYRLDLGKLLFSIMNPHLSQDIFGSLLKTKTGKVSLKTLQSKVTKSARFYDAYCPVKFERFYQGQYYSIKGGKHAAISLIPRIPIATMFKLIDETRLKKDNIPGGEIIPYGAEIKFDIFEQPKSMLRMLMAGAGPGSKSAKKSNDGIPKEKKTVEFVGGDEVAKLKKSDKKRHESKIDRRNHDEKQKTQFSGKIMVSQRRDIRAKDII